MTRIERITTNSGNRPPNIEGSGAASMERSWSFTQDESMAVLASSQFLPGRRRRAELEWAIPDSPSDTLKELAG
jgi:hypothetical protein